MLTNQDRRRILNQVRSSESQDIIAALRGQVSPAPEQSAMSTPEPVSIPQSPQPIDVDFPESPSLPSNLVDSTTSEPTQLAKEGGVKSRNGSTYVINKKAVITDPVRNTEYFSKTPMYEGQPHSTHLMADDDKLTAWATIFQDKQGNWFEGGRKEAEKRGEIYKFDTKEEMIDFARKGNWKNEINTKKQTGGLIDFITDPIRKRIAENLEPYSYEKPLKRLADAVIFNKKDPERLDADEARYGPMWWADRTDDFASTTERMDLLNMTMGQPQKYNSIEKAIYKPTKAKDPDAEYYRSIVTENKIKQLIKDDNLVPGYGYAGGVLGEFKIQEGEDKKGKYYSYYDKWDLNPLDHSIGSPKLNELVDKVTKAVGITPPEIYGRVYLNDLEEEQTVGAKVNEERKEQYRLNIKRLEKEFLQQYGYKAPKGYFSTNPDYDEKQDGGLRNHMMEYMNFSGRDTNNVNLVMNAIAEHESKNKFDEIQVSQKDDGTLFDGPGRGLFQFVRKIKRVYL